jgi:hypothetical protein
MITLRKSEERGHFEYGGLNAYYTFSFNNYYDPEHMGFRHLRVINQDLGQGGGGIGMHPHRDMEIITYVLEGAVAHKDSLGTESVIYPGEVQRMSAGTGITHSEFNHSQTKPVHVLQIWILPQEKGITPSYEQRAFKTEEKRGKWRLVAAKDGRDGAVTVHQDVDLFVTLLEPGEQVTHQLQPNRHAWMQVARGAGMLNGVPLKVGDGAAVSEEEILQFSATDVSEILLFDLA